MSPVTVDAITVKIGGAEISADDYGALIEAKVDQSIQLPDAFSLRFGDPEFRLIDELSGLAVGASMDISFAGKPVIQKGEITSISADLGRTGRHELTIAGFDKAHRLAKVARVEAWREQRDSDIAASIAQKNGLTSKVDTTSVQHEHLIQTETDFAFLTKRARANGFRWWVSDGTLHFQKDAKSGSGAPVDLTWGEDLYSFKVRFTASEAAADVEVRGWDADAQRAVVEKKKVEPGTGVGGRLQLKKAGTEFKGARFRGDLAAGSPQEAKDAAAGMAEAAATTAITARGVAAGDPGIRAGKELNIEGAGTQLSGRYLLTSVEHVYRAGEPYVTRFTSGGRDAAAMPDLLGGNGSPRLGGLWSTSDLVVGKVTNLNDPDNVGRVKVQFPTLGDQIESWWARVVSVGAGDQRGQMVLPEVGDEVIVGFEHGDIRRPLILGGVWSKKNKPPQTSTAALKGGQVKVRQLKTRVGHIIEWHDGDSKGDKKLMIELSDGSTRLTLAEDEVILEAPNDITIDTKKNLTLKAIGDISIEGKNIAMKANAEAKIDATSGIKIKAIGATSVEGLKVDIKGTAGAKVEAAGMTEIKGAMVKLN